MIREDLAALMDSVGVVVRDYVSASLRSIVVRLDEFDARIKAIPAGEKGDRGEKGDPGESIVGPAGEKGERGESVVGPQGPEGKPGESIKGERGIDGIAGPAGPQGIPGEPGQQGAMGDPGEQGKPGERGADGTNGKDGVGIDGKPGERGLDGKDGADGRDALEIEILPALDETRMFPRGTFACYQGGIVRAFRNTEPIAAGQPLEKSGWEVVVAGIASFSVAQLEDPRSFEARHALTGGVVTVTAFRYPIMVQRGIWTTKAVYEKGDCVTYDGSQWHCEVERSEGIRPGATGDWRLIAKRGNDGKGGGSEGSGPTSPPIIRLK